MKPFKIAKNISEAETLPANFYKSDEIFKNLKEKVFYKSWQLVGHESLLNIASNVYPFEFLKDYINEPLILVNNEKEKYRCLTNVCTHRANIIVNDRCKVSDLRCMYHGRKFHLDGKFKSMPEFEHAKNFPRDCDNLKEFELRKLGPYFFVGLEPAFDIQKIFDHIIERTSFIPYEKLQYRSDLSKDYLVNSHWALYCDNYLEGFHIPFVHNDLNNILDYGDYDTEIYENFNLQIGYAKDAEEVFNLPNSHIDFGQNVAAYYYWIFPNIMLNFYPWGLSINIVKPISINKTKVQFLTYVFDESKLETGAGSSLDKVEREDEFVVEGVQKGINSKYYKTGRFSPTKEKGVHHFHSLLSNFINT
ncbi:MAG: SRPBCC family protein [Bacteroidota bacterium]